MNKNTIKFTLLAVACLMFAQTATAAPEIKSFVPQEPVIPVSSIKRGMKGYLKTVLQGKTISKHSIQVEGVLPRKTAPHNLILIKITDKKLLEAGGGAAGMSGSPVYINGKLAGGFAYSWSFADKSLGLVTPIEEMCNALAWRDFVPTPIRTEEESSSDFMAVDHIGGKAKVESDDDTEAEDRDCPPPVLIEDFEALQEEEKQVPVLIGGFEAFEINMLQNKKIIPLSFVLLSDGLGERQLKKLEQKLGTKIVPLAAASDAAGGVRLDKRLAPGASMGAVLAWGDITLGGIGTLTATDKDGRFLAFGHPMMGRGAVAIPLTESEIIRIIPNLEQPFKLGSIGAIIGMVSQDRPEAIGGHFGKIPPAVSYSVLFHDLDNDRTKAKRFRTIVDPFIAPELGESGIMAILENEWARQGEGTLMYKITVKGGGLEHPWERKDIFFSQEDVLKSLEKNLSLLTQIFALNKFEEINPLGIEFHALMTRAPHVAFVEKFEIEDEKEFYEPGEKLIIKATIRPWRGEPVTKRLSLYIPEKAVGMCEIDVRAGCIEPIKEMAVLRGLTQITSFESLLRELAVQETNNMLIAEIGGPEMPDDKKSKHESTLGKMDKHRMAEDEKEEKEKQEINTEDEEDEDENKIPKFLTDSRLMSEVLKDKLKEGSICILDTNYYMDGLLRKFIKIKKSDDKADEIEQQLVKLMEAISKEEKKAKEKAKAKGKDGTQEPSTQYFKLNGAFRNLK